MRPVGAIEQTITVSGAAPMVDTQNVIQQRVISRGRDVHHHGSRGGDTRRVIDGMRWNSMEAGNAGTETSALVGQLVKFNAQINV